MNLTEDEVKILLNILNQLNFKPADFKTVGALIDKLQSGVKSPETIPADPGSYDPSNPDKIAEAIEGEITPD